MFVSKVHLRNFKSFPNATVTLQKGFNAVVGPNGSGKCLKGDCEVFIPAEGLRRIGDVVESRLSACKSKEVLDDGEMTLSNEGGLTVVSLNPATGKTEEKRIQAFVKRKSPEKLLEISTASGRTVTATAYHPVITVKDGRITEARADELAAGSFIATPRHIEVADKRFNFALELAEQETKLYLGGGCGRLRALLKGYKISHGKKWRQIAFEAGIPYYSLKGLIDGQSITLDRAFKLGRYLKLDDMDLTEILREVKGKNSVKATVLPLDFTPELAKLIGYVLSEGRVAENEVFFFNNSQALREDFSFCARKAFGTGTTECTYKNKKFLVLPSAVVSTFLEKLFGLKKHSRSKEIPDKILLAPLPEAKAFLSALYDGDGHVPREDCKKVNIEYDSASRKLIRQLAFLLLRFGCVARITTALKCATNTKARTKRAYHRASVYGIENAKKMLEALDYSIEKKHSLQKLIDSRGGKKAGTNVDVIPGANALIRDLLRQAGFSSRKLKAVAPARVRAYYENRCLPTREGVSQVVALINGTTQPVDASALESLACSQVFWDRITRIKEVPGEEWVYDLCVEGNHNFLAEGIFVHNSNICDSMLFAFGESSLKSMRVKKTSDLIFGNNKVAEVTVTLADGPGASHAISRMVKRDGKTKYTMDGRRTKRYAIEELLAQNSLSRTNIVKQGEVQRIVEMNAKDRRMLIDMAANVSEYEDKKREALGELTSVEDKLKESATVLAEREGYLKELENEKDNALKYQDLKKRLDQLKATIISIDLRGLEAEFEAVINSMVDRDNKLAAVAAKVKEAEALISQCNAEKEAVNNEIIKRTAGAEQELQRRIDALAIGIETTRKSIEERTANAATTEEKLKGKKLEFQRASDEVSGAKREEGELSAEVAALRKMLEERTGEYNAMLDSSNSFSRQFHEARSFLEKAQEEMLGIKEKLNQLQAEVSTAEEVALMKERERKRIVEGEFEDFANKKKELEAQRKELENPARAASKELDELFSKERKLNERLPAVEDELLDAKEKAVEASSKIRNAGEGAGRTAEAIAAVKEKIPGVFGTVEELCHYPSKYSVPFQVAFGPRSSFAIVDSVRTASKAIDFLKSNKLGRVSFIPLDKIHSSAITPEDRQLAQKPGCMGFVIDKIEFDEQYKRAFEFVCSNTVLADGMKSAEPLVGKIRVVTMEGELGEASGLVTGGAFQAKVSVVAEQRKLEEMEQRLEQAKAEKDDIVAELAGLREAMAEARKGKAEAELALRAVEIQLKHVQETEDAERKKKANVHAAAAQLEEETKQLRKGIGGKNEERSALVRKLSELNLAILDAKQKIDVEKEASFGQRLKERERAINELRVQFAEYENKLKAASERKGLYEKQEAAVRKELDDDKASLDALEKAIKEEKEFIEKSTAELRDKKEEQKRLSSALTDLLNRRERLEGQIAKLGNEKGKLEFERERIERGMQDEKIRKAVLENQLTTLKAQLDEYAGVTPLEGKEAKDKPELVAMQKEAQAGVEALGAVNLRAIELYEARSREFDEQRRKVQQLITEKEAVIGVINEIEGRKVATFLETFNMVNTNFKKIFTKIFPGEGTLYLENPENPFEGGLTIQVKLETKEVKYLELMSGGEKSLIALIFILALQSTNPSNVYILDEADAALDAENSRKLAQLLRSLATETQFIVITHNQQVYKHAHSLVGVAMTKEGSRLVEVKLGE